MPWDPLGAWPSERRWIWLTLAGWLFLLRGPAFIKNLEARPPQELIPDFFQDYASARNWLEGLPIYSSHFEAAPRYLGVSLKDRRAHVVVNSHPPPSVLLVLPLAELDFADAFLAWNLVSLAALAGSLWIVQGRLQISVSLWSIPPLVAMLLLCYPLWELFSLGQMTGVLLLLVTGTWAADRSGRPSLAGALLGTATSIKLIPGVLLLYYMLRGRWKVAATGLMMIACLVVLSATLLGIEAYRSYILTVLPEIQWFRVGWDNNSLWGFWSRLFDPAPERVRMSSFTEALIYSPALAKALSVASSAAIIGVMAWAVRCDVKGQRTDLTFALAITSMLLVSPVCWSHYLLLLLVPLAVVWNELPASRFARALFLAIVSAFWLGYPLVWTAAGLTDWRVASPLHSLGVLSYEFYALLALFALILMELRLCSVSRHGTENLQSSPESSRLSNC
jgi:hypothetical protein